MAEFRNTNDFIDRKRVYADLSRLLITDACGGSMISNYDDGWTSAISKAMDMIMEAPTADVRPERHGRWIFDSDDEYVIHYHCSECGTEIDLCNEIYTEPKPNYCSNCGAKMDKGRT